MSDKEEPTNSESANFVVSYGQGCARKSDGGIYLVVADETPEFDIALRYAAKLSEVRRAKMAVLYVADLEDFQHWGNIEKIMKNELRAKSEDYIWKVAKKVNEVNGTIPILYLREGDVAEELLKIINGDDGIKMLVLASGSGVSGGGPLINYFVNKAMDKISIPVVIVPGHIDDSSIETII